MTAATVLAANVVGPQVGEVGERLPPGCSGCAAGRGAVNPWVRLAIGLPVLAGVAAELARLSNQIKVGATRSEG